MRQSDIYSETLVKMSKSTKTYFSTHWGEMDALGHINHTRYLVWMETARIELFRAVGLLDNPDVGPILANINVDYRSPVHHPSDLWCDVWVTRLGGKSFTMAYSIGHKGDDTSVVDGTTVIVVYDYKNNCSAVIPDLVRAALGVYVRT